MEEEQNKYGIRFLDPKDVRVELDAFQDLRLVLRGEQTFEKVNVLQALPLSAPYTHIEFHDRNDNAIGLLRDAETLDRKSRSILEADLDKTYFIPVITKIFSIDRAFPGSDWYVETNRGEKRFKVRFQRESRSIGSGLYLIVDVEGTKYLIRNRRQLDLRSQKLLDEYI